MAKAVLQGGGCCRMGALNAQYLLFGLTSEDSVALYQDWKSNIRRGTSTGSEFYTPMVLSRSAGRKLLLTLGSDVYTRCPFTVPALCSSQCKC
jgi:hypothetical protein